MNLCVRKRGLIALLAVCFLFSAFCFSGRAQATLDVSRFGAVGDAECFSVSTVSNSTVVSVTGTNRFSSADVGKVIEVFRAGPWIYYKSSAVVTQQDIICLVTKVSDGTNLSLSIPCGWTMNAYCVVGTNNAPAFQAAIKAASRLVARRKAKNVTIEIPPGRYLMVSPQVLDPKYVMNSASDTHPALTISSGGITFLGDSATNTILMGCGAGMEHEVKGGLSWIGRGYAPFVPMRDTLVMCKGPVAKSQYPLVFQNLTFDGGLTNGLQAYNYWIPIQGNGAGWDTTHHAVADFGGVNNVNGKLVQWQMNQMKVFTNCIFQHWRGEVLICWTGDIPNAFNDIANCAFYDGNGTADNMYYGQHVHGCTFDRMGKVMEYYQGNASLPMLFENNLITNIAPNNHYALTIVGATTNTPPPDFTIRNNQFHLETGISAIQFSPAANVSVVSNSFFGRGNGLVFTYAGVQPSDGSAIPLMENFLVADNTFKCGYPLLDEGYPIKNMMISNNVGFYMSISTVYAKNIVLANNLGVRLASHYDVMAGPTTPGRGSPGITGGQYPLDETNNQWILPVPYPPDAGDYFATNIISYGNGRTHELQVAGATFYLDDLHPTLIPPGAELHVLARTWNKANVTNFFTSAVSPGAPMTITNGAPPVTFYWAGDAWQLK